MKAAVIGAGHIARQHLACLRELPGVEVVGVCDLSPALAESAAERFGVGGWFTDHRSMLAETQPDVVHIATPAATHFVLAADVLDAATHVIVEKPITLRYDDLTKLIELARKNHCMLLEDHNYLFNNPVQRLLAWVRSGELGDVIHVDVVLCLNLLGEGSRLLDPNAAHASLSLPGGIIAEYLTHLAYLSYAFVGKHHSVRTVWKKRTAASPLPSDEFRALIDAERGTSILSFSAHSQPDAFFIRVYGTKMRAEAHLFEPRLTSERLRSTAKPLMPMINGLSRSWDELRSAFRSAWRKLEGGPGPYEGQWELLRRSYRALEEGGDAPIPIRQIEAVNQLVMELIPSEDRE